MILETHTHYEQAGTGLIRLLTKHMTDKSGLDFIYSEDYLRKTYDKC